MINATELQRRIDGMYAEPHSDEGQAVIHNDDTHVLEVWEDGELTSTKSGDLYGNRSLHQSEPPLLPEGQVLFSAEDIDEDWELWRDLRLRNKHKRMVVTDSELVDILDEYRDFGVNKEVIDFVNEHME